MSARSIQSNVFSKSDVSFFIFCLDGQFITRYGVLKSPTINVLLSVAPFKFVFP